MTTEEKTAALKSGRPLIFPTRKPTEPPALRIARTIEGSWIKDLIAEGEVRVPIAIEGGIIRGALKLTAITFRFDLSITATEFEDEVHLNFAKFAAGLDLSGSVLNKGMTLRGARIANDVMIEACRFDAPTLLQDVEIGQALNAKGAFFQRVNFERTEIRKNAFFNYSGTNQTPAVFRGTADFKQVVIRGSAEFDGTQFYGDVKFDGAHLGRLFLRPDTNDPKRRPARFAKDVSFISALFDDTTLIAGTLFAGEAIFDNAHFQGLYFEPAVTPRGTIRRVRFRRKADFLGARVEGRAQFEGVLFCRHANFDQFAVLGLAYFRSWPYRRGTEENIAPITFHSVTFTAAHFYSLVQFWGAQFKRDAHFRDVKFDGRVLFGSDTRKFVPPASFEGATDFSNSQFGSTADFVGVKCAKALRFERVLCARDASFDTATFNEELILRDSRFEILSFGIGDQEAHFHRTKSLDMRGVHYERLNASWETIHHYMWPYHRQQYDLMQKIARDAGEDTQADHIYYARRKYELNLLWGQRRLATTLHAFHWLLSGFGVRLRRLAFVTVSIIVIGTLVFHQPGATRPAMSPVASPSEPLNYASAMGVSFRQFIPIDVSSGKTVEPTTNRMPVLGISFSAYATLQRLAGLILVPLWVAAVTTQLRRKSTI